MSVLDNAVVVDSELFSSIAGEAKEAVFEYRLTMPFKVDKEHTPEHADDDVVVYGPVYVGDDTMLDRHKELVDAKAIMDSWESYNKNPVILYNHRKDYGVIGLMESVEMGMWEKPDGEKIEAVFGRARIDGGEKDITRKINKGMLRAFSIGFIAKAGVKQGSGNDEYLTFTEIEWIETSVVDIPASPNALFGVSKSLISYDGEKHIIAVEERDDSIIVEFGKSEMYDEPDPPSEETELSFDADILVELTDTIAGLEAKLAELQERIGEPIDGDTVKGHDDSQQGMTDQEIAVTEEVTEEVVELSAPEEELKTTEVVEVKSEETEEVAEEEAEEVLEEELPEEVVEESAEESAEEPVDEELAEELVELSEETTTGVEVLSEVVSALTSVETGLKDLVARLDETESLKTLLAERDATIASLTESKAAAEAEAQIEAEVSRRLGEKMAEIGMPAPSAPSAKPKSLSPTTKTVTEKSGPTKHDPQPEVSKGMASLGSWLEGRLAGKMLE